MAAGHSPGSYKDHKHPSKAPRSPSKVTSSSMSSETAQHQNPPTPPPVTFTSTAGTSSIGDNSTNGGSGTSSSNPMMNGDMVSSPPQVKGAQRRDSTQSDDGNIQLLFSPSIDGSARMASTGNDVRDRCRDLIAKALKKGFSDSKLEDRD